MKKVLFSLFVLLLSTTFSNAEFVDVSDEVEHYQTVSVICPEGGETITIPMSPGYATCNNGDRYNYTSVLTIFMEEYTSPTPPDGTWAFAFKDINNSATNQEQIQFPLSFKWQENLDTVFLNVPKMTYANGTIVINYPKYIVKNSEATRLLAYDLNGIHKWYGYNVGYDDGIRGLYPRCQEKIMVGLGHNANYADNESNGTLFLKFDYNAGPKNGYSICDNERLYSNGNSGSNSTSTTVRATSLTDYLAKWVNYVGSINVEGIGARGWGMPAVGDYFFVANGKLQAYDKATGAIVWDKGCFPNTAEVGKAVHFGHVVLKDNSLFVLGKEVVEEWPEDWPHAYPPPIWSECRLYEYSQSGNFIDYISLNQVHEFDWKPFYYWTYSYFSHQYIITDDRIIVSSYEGLKIFNRQTKEILYQETIPTLIDGSYAQWRDCPKIILAYRDLLYEHPTGIKAINLDSLNVVWEWDYTPWLQTWNNAIPGYYYRDTFISDFMVVDGEIYLVTNGVEFIKLGR